MPDHDRNALAPKLLFGGTLAFLTIFPLFTVNTTSSGMRVVWISFLIMLAVIGVLAHLRTIDDPQLRADAERQYKSSYLRRYGRPLISFALGILLITEILAVAATYATPDRPLVWQVTQLIAGFGDALFPLIGKYATQMAPPLPPHVLYKVQTVMTLFLLAGAIIFIPSVLYYICIPHEDALIMQRMADKMRPSRLSSSPAAILFILVPFSILCGIAFFLGTFEFDPDPEYLTRKKCFMKATCYAFDDLFLIATGFMRVAASYGAWLAGIMLTIKAITAQTE